MSIEDRNRETEEYISEMAKRYQNVIDELESKKNLTPYAELKANYDREIDVYRNLVKKLDHINSPEYKRERKIKYLKEYSKKTFVRFAATLLSAGVIIIAINYFK